MAAHDFDDIRRTYKTVIKRVTSIVDEDCCFNINKIVGTRTTFNPCFYVVNLSDVEQLTKDILEYVTNRFFPGLHPLRTDKYGKYEVDHRVDDNTGIATPEEVLRYEIHQEYYNEIIYELRHSKGFYGDPLENELRIYKNSILFLLSDFFEKAEDMILEDDKKKETHTK